MKTTKTDISGITTGTAGKTGNGHPAGLNRLVERYRQLYEGLLDGIAFVDTGGFIVDSNESFRKMLGYDVNELARLTYSAITPAKWHSVESRIINDQVLISGSSRVYEKEYIRKDGTVFPVELRTLVIRNDSGEIEGYGAVVRDITAKRDAEKALRNSEARLRSWFELPIAGIAVTSPETGWLEVNDHLCEMLGYPAEELLKKTWTSLTHPDDLPQDTEKFNMVMNGVMDGYTIDKRFIRSDGQVLWTNLSVRCVRDNTGKVDYFVALLIDITARKNSEEKITALYGDLEKKVAERTAQLNLTNKELEAFTYSVSHDLRAPLRAINGFAKALNEDFWEVLNDEGKRYLGFINDNVKAMDQLIGDLLTFSRYGRKELELSDIDMNALVSAVMQEISSLQEASTVTFHIDTLPVAYGDPSLVRQVWINLISNSVKFTMKKESRIIEIGSLPGENNPVYFVKDNGAGFNMKYIDKLFGVFQRLHSVKEFEGTGVGLAIVKRIVQRLNGKVWAEGIPDEGASFYFSLPGKSEK